jgi:hypothetical protein
VRINSCVALFALCIQFAVAFAHIHLEDFNRSAPDPHSSSALANAESGAPRHPDHGGPAHDDCAICASIFLASTAIPTSPPALATPVVFHSTLLPRITVINFRLIRYVSFRTRAPPLA